jgi:hypothetical protein
MNQAAVVSRFVLAFVFLGAGLSKLLNRQPFADAVMAYRLLPERASKLIGMLLPFLETSCGVALALGIFARPTALLVASLLIAFIFAVAVNLRRGRPIDCGCVGATVGRASSTISWWTVARNMMFLAMAALTAADLPAILSVGPRWHQPADSQIPVGDGVADLMVAMFALAGVLLALGDSSFP